MAPLEKPRTVFSRCAGVAHLQAGATDGLHLNGVGIPTYGIEPCLKPDSATSTASMNTWREIAADARIPHDLVKIYSSQK